MVGWLEGLGQRVDSTSHAWRSQVPLHRIRLLTLRLNSTLATRRALRLVRVLDSRVRRRISRPRTVDGERPGDAPRGAAMGDGQRLDRSPHQHDEQSRVSL